MIVQTLVAVVLVHQQMPLPVYVCPFVEKGPVIDGSLADEAWKTAPRVELVDAVTGGKCTKPTTARMCWDENRLYIAFESVDPDVWGTMTQRDDLIYREEVVEAFIDPECCLHHYFEFNVSPRNVVFDAYIVNPDGLNPGEGTNFGWNCEGVETGVTVDGTLDNRSDVDKGWTAEIAIPFKSLGRTTPKAGERWRVNLFRIDLSPPPKEFQAWSAPLFDPPRFHVPKRFGTVFFSKSF
ncbi:MAG: carbohydrate-binding family 9-like protein [Armatimonadota bacterium]|nr:carbohydrate-binding family 9-like protein [Armatimonadota bacterium]